jgi:hypothetical protein
MIVDLFTVYMESLTAFYRGIFGGGLFQMLFIGFIIWWFLCRKGGRCSCPHCGCWFGNCRCDEVRINDEPSKKKKAKEEA